MCHLTGKSEINFDILFRNTTNNPGKKYHDVTQLRFLALDSWC